MNQSKSFPILVVTVLILIAALTRLIPHWPNFTAVGAIALFGAAKLKNPWQALVIPFAALYLSDLLLNNIVYANFYDHFVWQISPFVYVAFLLIIGIGYWLKQRVSTTNIIFGSLGASLVFFLLTNAASWYISPMYTKDFSGLMMALTAGLPFFWNTIAGDLFFSGVLFGGYAWLSRRYPALRMARIHA